MMSSYLAAATMSHVNNIHVEKFQSVILKLLDFRKPKISCQEVYDQPASVL